MNRFEKLLLQFTKFTGVGVFCFLIDFGSLFVLTHFFHVHYLVSAAIAFIISVIFNYYLSVKLVFTVNKKYPHSRNFIIFVILSAIGLGITELIMMLCVDHMHINYLIAKIISAVIVSFYNFITRKIFLEH